MKTTGLRMSKIQRLGSNRILEAIETALERVKIDYFVEDVDGPLSAPLIRIVANPNAAARTEIRVIVGTSTVKIVGDLRAIFESDQIRCRLSEADYASLEISSPGQRFSVGNGMFPGMFRVVQEIAIEIGSAAGELEN